MPYEGEFASHKSLNRLASSERVKKLLGSYEVRERESAEEQAPLIIASAPESEWLPDIVLAIDGSHAEVKIEKGFPGAEASYITVSSVLLDVAKMRQLDAHRPIDPREFRKIEKSGSIDCALPGCNVVYKEQDSAAASLRRTLFDEFVHNRIDSETETLLETYEALLQYKPADSDLTKSQKCPYADGDCQNPQAPFTRATGEYICSCPLARQLYSTDALRIHEAMNPAGTNGKMFGEIMQVWERILVIHFLRFLERKNYLSSLRRIAIIVDGPLAVFGHPAWLSSAIQQELQRLNEATRRVTGGQDILLLGIEKGGVFAEHLLDLDRYPNGSLDRFPSQKVGLLDDAYIKHNIIFSKSDRPYGRNTYFGRKFFYKTRTGALIVGLLPYLREGDDDLSHADIEQYPRLADALALLDELVCVRYPNSLSALVAAHAEAAIPLNLGNNILEQLARRLMGQDKVSGTSSTVPLNGAGTGSNAQR